MQVTNLAYFYETSRRVRGGKWVWVKDSNGESRHNILLGGTILNPNKDFGHLWAGQLLDYAPQRGYYIFRSFEVVSATGTTVNIKGDGYSDVPEVGMLLMVAPDDVATTGQSAKVTKVVYDTDKEEFIVTVDTALTASQGDILVEAAGEDASGSAEVLVKNPNNWVEADRDLMPTEGYGLSKDTNYSISGVYGKQAWIARMQPLPKYVLALNKSHIPGIFEV